MINPKEQEQRRQAHATKKELEMIASDDLMGWAMALSLEIMFWNCRGYHRIRLRLNDVAHDINIIFLFETWGNEANCLLNIDGYVKKSVWPHIRNRIGWARVALLSIICKYDDVWSGGNIM